MEYSKLNDLDAVRVCLEIMRPHCAASAYRTGSEYIAADIERCGLSANGRAYISLRLESKAPEAVQCPIYGLQLANYCTSRSHDLRNVWEWLRAFYHAYGYAMQMAIADRDTAEAAANWLENWHTRWESVQQPIADAAALLLAGKVTTKDGQRVKLSGEERERIELVQAQCSLYSEYTKGRNFDIEHKHRRTAAEDAPEILASLVDREAIAAALENLAKPLQRRAAAPVQFCACVQYANSERLLKRLHELIDHETSPASVGAIFYRARTLRYLKRNPTQSEWEAEFPKTKEMTHSAITNYMPVDGCTDSIARKAEQITIFDKEDRERELAEIEQRKAIANARK